MFEMILLIFLDGSSGDGSRMRSALAAVGHFFRQYLIRPFLQIMKTVFQKRERNLRLLLFIQV